MWALSSHFTDERTDTNGGEMTWLRPWSKDSIQDAHFESLNHLSPKVPNSLGPYLAYQAH